MLGVDRKDRRRWRGECLGLSLKVGGRGEVGPVTSQSAGPSLGSRDHKADNELETSTTVTKVQQLFFSAAVYISG